MPRPEPAFERLSWRDPATGLALEPLVAVRNPSGVPLMGALRVSGTRRGYPIVDSVARLTPELAQRYREWLEPFGLEPPGGEEAFQPERSVDSFGFQWSWNAEMRSEADLRWRVAERFRVAPDFFRHTLVLDAGAGAGDQSRWLLRQEADVVSVDLSSAIDVVAGKLRGHPGWVGVQGDVTALPFADQQFERVYCEGVIQHTRDSARTVGELCRVLRPGGTLLVTHYALPRRLRSRMKGAYVAWLRRRLRRWDRYKLLLLTGNLTALGYLPLVGRVFRLSGTTVHYDLMPDFKTSWTNTFDCFGPQAFQRHISPEEFHACVRKAGAEIVHSEGTVVVATRLP